MVGGALNHRLTVPDRRGHLAENHARRDEMNAFWWARKPLCAPTPAQTGAGIKRTRSRTAINVLIWPASFDATAAEPFDLDN